MLFLFFCISYFPIVNKYPDHHHHFMQKRKKTCNVPVTIKASIRDKSLHLKIPTYSITIEMETHFKLCSCIAGSDTCIVLLSTMKIITKKSQIKEKIYCTECVCAGTRTKWQCEKMTFSYRKCWFCYKHFAHSG